MTDAITDLTTLVPSPGDAIDWEEIDGSGLAPVLRQMAQTPQNPAWHGEGDVLAHARLVCENLIRSDAWQGLARDRQEILFIAALLHDVGKISCTKPVDGVLVSPHHAMVGEQAVRALLWRDLGIGGTYQSQQFREAICALIRHHTVPQHFLDDSEPVVTAVRLAATGDLVPAYSNRLLAGLVEADIRGRVAHDTAEFLDQIAYFTAICQEAGCGDQPVDFPSGYSRHAYLSGRKIGLGQDLYDDTWGTVILMAGLPGAGKDTYIREHYPGLPVVSLDELRQEMKISPAEPQGKVIRAAQERAKTHLRRRQPFVWNATNVTSDIRRKQIQLFKAYGAAVTIVYVETAWNELLRRNRTRAQAVPEPVINHLLEKLAVPQVGEAHEIEWVIS